MRKLFLFLISVLLLLVLNCTVRAAQHDYVISNADGATVRADINAVLQAIASNNANSTEPATTYAYQWWLCTANGTLQIRDASNTGWIAFANATTGQPFVVQATNATRGTVTLASVNDYTSYDKALSPGAWGDTIRTYIYEGTLTDSDNGTITISGIPFPPKSAEVMWSSAGSQGTGWATQNANGTGYYHTTASPTNSKSDFFIYGLSTGGVCQNRWDVYSWTSDGIVLHPSPCTPSGTNTLGYIIEFRR